MEYENIGNDQLLSHFNKRDSDAFGTIYSILYKELHYYTATITHDTEIIPADMIHDVFINLWQSESMRFESVLNIKVYLFAAIKNNFRNYLKHHKIKERYKTLSQEDIHISDVVESELYIQVQESLNLLPEECANVIKLLIEGYDTDDIAALLGKKTQTIYNTKHKAVNILRKKLTKEKLYILSVLIH